MPCRLLGGFVVVMLRLRVVSVREVSVMARLLAMPGVKVLLGFVMVLGCVLVMLRGMLMVFGVSVLISHFLSPDAH